MANWFVYMVLCSDSTIYTGISTNPKRREVEHNNKKGARSLYGKLPVKLVYIEKHKDKVSAAKREREIKGWNHLKKTSLISKGFTPRSEATRGGKSRQQIAGCGI